MLLQGHFGLTVSVEIGSANDGECGAVVSNCGGGRWWAVVSSVGQ
jgi:hypothetical protein